MRVNKVFLVICFVIFFLLLAWPAVILTSYMFISGPLKVIFILTFLAIEIALGAFLITWLITNRKNIKKWKFIFMLGIVGVCYIGYISSLIIVYIVPR